MEDLVTAVIAEVFIAYPFAYKMLHNTGNKGNRPFAFSLWIIDPEGARFHEWIFCISK